MEDGLLQRFEQNLMVISPTAGRTTTEESQPKHVGASDLKESWMQRERHKRSSNPESRSLAQVKPSASAPLSLNAPKRGWNGSPRLSRRVPEAREPKRADVPFYPVMLPLFLGIAKTWTTGTRQSGLSATRIRDGATVPKQNQKL